MMLLFRHVVFLTHFVAEAAPATTAAPVTTAPLGPPTTPPAPTAPPEAARSEEAKQLYAVQRYIESARMYAGLYAEFKAPKYLFNEAAAREAAGHDAHAYVLYRRYLESPGLSAEDLERGETQMVPLRRRTATIQLRFTTDSRPEASPSVPKGLVVTMTRAGVDPLVLDEEALAALDRRGTIEVWVEVGESPQAPALNWSIQAQAPGLLPLSSSVQSTAGATKVLALHFVAAETPATAPAAPVTGQLTVNFLSRRRRHPADLRLLLQHGDVRMEKAAGVPETTWELPVGTWKVRAASFDFTTAPAAVQIVPAVPAQLSLTLRRTPLSRAKLGLALGAGVLAGLGPILMGVGWSQWNPNRFSQPGTRPHIKWLRLDDAGAGLLGTGMGLALGSAGFALERKARRPHVLWGVLAGSGALALVTGAIVRRYPTASIQNAHDNPIPWDPGNSVSLLRASEVLLGSGVGLLFSSVLRLILLQTQGQKP